MSSLKDALSAIKKDLSLAETKKEVRQQPQSIHEMSVQPQQQAPSEECLFLDAVSNIDEASLEEKYSTDSGAIERAKHDGQTKKDKIAEVASEEVDMTEKQLFLEAVGDVCRNNFDKKFE